MDQAARNVQLPVDCTLKAPHVNRARRGRAAGMYREIIVLVPIDYEK